MEDRLLKLKEASLILGVSPRTIRKWDAAGKLTCVRTPGNQRRVRLSDVRRLVGGDQSQ